jgi:hypothetical protein
MMRKEQMRVSVFEIEEEPDETDVMTVLFAPSFDEMVVVDDTENDTL